MKQLIEGFAHQLEQAVKIGKAAKLPEARRPIRHVAVLGLGGSAFGGELSRNLMEAQGVVPLTIHRGYTAPAFIGPETLCIVSSYSGNTEETLATFEQVMQKGAQVVCVTSGGRLLELAQKHHLPFIQLPTGYPPRSAAGFSFVQQCFILHHYGLMPSQEAGLREAITILEDFMDHGLAKRAAQAMQDRLPIIYCTDAIDSIAIRLRQQINENSKQLCWHHVVPEMNHNELVGWKLPTWLYEKCVVVTLKSAFDHPRNQIRFGINHQVFAQHTANFVELNAKGESLIAQLLYLLHLSDWISLYLADLNQVEATPVNVIDFLKAELAKQ